MSKLHLDYANASFYVRRYHNEWCESMTNKTNRFMLQKFRVLEVQQLGA
jgi:hypothetical protein